ncbi:hypothetical protein QR680_016213 [Steinernema hermaphroditum]|uniref:Transmembrane protein n=1 Tax=Steinernema hermaphroditum TaxID=289476 RepID=A0AA39LLL2_9BILA|nr:hypothetical protein QR680_016213 [Steinernema hermaphroditum]
MYVIVRKSPKHLGVYKYILLKISLWVFMGDIVMDIFLIPTPTPTSINAVYLNGLSALISPFAGSFCGALCVFCVAECFVGLCIAFFFRYQALSHNFRLFGWQPEPMHYRFVVAVMVVVPPGTLFVAGVYGFFPSEDFVRMVLNENAELVHMIGNSVLVGPEKQGIMVIGAALAAYIIFVIVFMALCIAGIMKQLRALRPSMSAATYAMQIQLMKSLVVQTAVANQVCQGATVQQMFDNFVNTVSQNIGGMTAVNAASLLSKLQNDLGSDFTPIRGAAEANAEYPVVADVYQYCGQGIPAVIAEWDNYANNPFAQSFFDTMYQAVISVNQNDWAICRNDFDHAVYFSNLGY